ncbi:YgaP family membrane protein [Halobacteriaceae archaeon SHR40]|uniref:YgaP family membrane protein n=1 Tax=Halovenus amylolytica TaxID=2500550 RepID=UPI000FE39411
MNRNVGSVDSTLRTAVGAVTGTVSIAILTGTLPFPTGLSPVLGIVAIIMLATATMGTCPIYSMFGIDSCSYNSSSP